MSLQCRAQRSASDLSWEVFHVKNLMLICNLIQNGSAPFDDINSYHMPSWTTLDLGARYVFGREKTMAILAGNKRLRQ
ncbi:hypothetical protein HDF09_002110 [Edaphobacter lichenicola]|uniref:Uncharacterized protein n=1 Tax=Tunturiibacter empetritectus TaxID=3069691 RepID=A0A7W8MR48_9BACT|nr:hypothetical protein [Edaphobacter lichenicola]